MNLATNFNSSTLIIILIIVCAYFLMISFFGVYFSKFSSSIHDFFFSGQRFAWWLPFFSMMATGIGSYSYLKYSQQGFNTGMSSVMGYMNDWFIMPLFFFAWLPILYFSRIKSIPEYFEKRFNKLSRYLAVFILLSYIFYYIGYNLFTIGLAFQGIFGFSPIYALPIIVLVLGTYVTLGGQTAVIFTDVIQGLLLYFVGFLTFGYGLYVLGGFEEFLSYLPTDYRIPFAPFRENQYFNSVGMFWGDAVAGSIAFIFLNQGFLMRYLSIRSVNEARIAGVANILISLPFSAVIVGSVGWLGKSLMMKQESLQQALMSSGFLQIEDSFHTFVTVVLYVVQSHPIVLGLILAALLAALMSTIDTLINAASAICIYDIYKPLIKPKASHSHYLRVARYFSIFSAFLGLLLVIWFYQQKGTLMSIHYKGIMMIIPSLVTTLLLGILWPRFNGKAASISLIVGVTCSFLTLFFPEWVYPLRDFVYGTSQGDPIYFRALFGMLVTALTGFLVTLVTKSSSKKTRYTLNGLEESMRFFKQGTPNLKKGRKVCNLIIQIDNKLPKNYISVSKKVAQQMKAQSSDIIYVGDQRWYLGGLRSAHLRLKNCHNQNKNLLKISKSTLNKSYLLLNQKVFSKKII